MIQKSNESKYLNNLFDFLLKLIKEMFSKYLEKQLESIKKYTCTIKHVNIIPFVSKYYLFVQKLNESLNSNLNKIEIETEIYFDIVSKIKIEKIKVFFRL